MAQSCVAMVRVPQHSGQPTDCAGLTESMQYAATNVTVVPYFVSIVLSNDILKIGDIANIL